MNYNDITLSFSSLKQFSRSPAHFAHYKKREFKQSTAMRRGWLTHLLTLEPEKLSEAVMFASQEFASKVDLECLFTGDNPFK